MKNEKTLIKIQCSGRDETRKLLFDFMDDKSWRTAVTESPSFHEEGDRYMRLDLPLCPRVMARMTSKAPYRSVQLEFHTSGTVDGFDEVSMMGILFSQFLAKRPKMRCVGTPRKEYAFDDPLEEADPAPWSWSYDHKAKELNNNFSSAQIYPDQSGNGEEEQA